MSKYEYMALIEDVFSKNGSLVEVGGRHNAQQQEYALCVADGISSSNSVVMAEAETGIGKSIGYLIPSLAYLSLNKPSKPIVVSTHTRALQRQLMEKDIPLAAKALEKRGIKLPLVAFRMGRQAFFSPSRVEDVINSLSHDEVTSDHKELLRFAQASVVSGSGLWMDYIDKYGTFPAGVLSDDICLLDLMVIDNPAYERHIEQAKKAELLITNHATILSNKVFSDNAFFAMICDEAHEIEGVCTGLATHKSQLKRIASAINDTHSTSKKTKQAIELASSIEGKLEDFDRKTGCKHDLISDINNANLMSEIQTDVLTLQKLMKLCRGQYVKNLSESPTHSEARVVDRLDRHIETMKSFDRGTLLSKRRAVAFSPIQRDSSIASVSLNAGMLFNYQSAKLTDRIVLVSATMSNANTKNLSFSHILGNLGIKEDRVTTQCSIAPNEFGEMTFVVNPNSAKPIIKDAEDDSTFSFDSMWLKGVANMIEAAASQGKTLVLTHSTKESKEIAKLLGCSYLLHDEHNPLIQLTGKFTEGDEPVLISAGAWNGVSLRNQSNEQLLSNIVITRIPFPPTDEEQKYLQQEYWTSKGYPESKIKAIQWTELQYKTMIKLKQGIGRGLRSPKDAIKVWFADPRMPTSSKSSGLIAAIPSRFLSNYHKAKIFNGKTEEEPETIFYL